MKNFHFGQNLRYIRRTNLISQQAIADEMGISQTRYSKLERREGVPEYELVNGIAKATGVPIGDLLPPDPLNYKPKDILALPFGAFFIIACICSFYPDAGGIANRLCSFFDLSPGTTAIVCRLTIPAIIYLIWCVVTLIKRLDKNR